jgi:hypothetical protein
MNQIFFFKLRDRSLFGNGTVHKFETNTNRRPVNVCFKYVSRSARRPTV